MKRSRGGPHNWPDGAAEGVAQPDQDRNCYDNDNNASLPHHYSTDYEGGSHIACSLSFEVFSK